VPTRCLLKGSSPLAGCVWRLKLRGMGKAKACVYCYSAWFVSSSVSSVLQQFPFTKLTRTFLVSYEHIRVQYSSFSLVLSLSSLVYILPMASPSTDKLKCFDSWFFLCWVFSRDCNCHRRAHSAFYLAFLVVVPVCLGRVRDWEMLGKGRSWEYGLPLVNLKWNGRNGRRFRDWWMRAGSGEKWQTECHYGVIMGLT